MTHPKHWLEIKPEGLYCIPGQFFIDPVNAVDKAVITHGHADHARAGHQKILATSATIDIMKLRYGENCAEQQQSLDYNQPLLINDVKITLIPAGHVLGSAQVLLEYQGSRLIISGDYKRQPDTTCLPFIPTACDIFISEATFALPIFQHPPIEQELQKLFQSIKQYNDHCHLIGAYALGKCQRIIHALRLLNYEDPIYLHGGLIKMCELYQSHGIDLGPLENANKLDSKTAPGKIIFCPPMSLRDRWTRRFGDIIFSLASGWMQIRARVKQKGVDLPLIISDHADWSGLTSTINEIDPQEVWVTHGQEDALLYYATQQGYKAKALSLLGYDEEED